MLNSAPFCRGVFIPVNILAMLQNDNIPSFFCRLISPDYIILIIIPPFLRF